MNAGKWINSCFAGYLAVSVISLTTFGLKAEPGFIPQHHLKTKYSTDIASFDYSTLSYKPGLYTTEQRGTLNISDSNNSRFQKKAGIAIYKAVTLSRDKLATRLASSAFLYGLDNVDMAGSLKNSFSFIKRKTLFNFGKCSQLRFNSSRLKASSCLFNERAKLEFHANYKMDAFNLKFNWPM